MSRGRAVRPYHQPEDAGSLILRLAGFFRVLRIRLIDNARRAHSAANTKHSATHAAAASLAYAGAGAHTHAATRA